MKEALRAALLVALLFMAARPARANVTEVIGLGPRALATGHARTSWGSDPAAAFYNPALLPLSRAVHVTFGFQRTDPFLHIERDLPICGGDAEACAGLHPEGFSPYHSLEPGATEGFTLGFTVPVDMGSLGDASLGVMLYFPSENFVKGQSTNVEYPHYVLYQHYMNRLAMDMSFGLRPVRWLSLGLGAQILTDVHGQQRLDLDLRNHQFAEQDIWVEAHPKLAAVAGLAILPDEHWSVGLAFRDELFLGFYLPSVMTLEQAVDFEMAYALESLYTPPRFDLGLSYTFDHGGVLAVTGSLALWSRLPMPSPPTYIDVTGPAIEETGLSDTLDLDSKERWPEDAVRDQWSAAVALSWPVLEWLTILSGYTWKPAITGDESGPFNYLDNDLHQISYGVEAAVALPSPFDLVLRVGLSGATGVLPERRVVKADPADPAGGYRHGGWMQSFGVSVSASYVEAEFR